MKYNNKRLFAFILSVMLTFSSSMINAEETVKDQTENLESPELVQTDENVDSETGIIGVPSVIKKEKTILYVAPDGKNTNPGTIDKPFATIEGARDALRELKSSGKIAEGGAVVYLRGGNYAISETINFNSADSGTKDAPILYRNFPDEKVNFVGGAAIEWSMFKKLTDETVLNRIIDESARSKIYVVDLFELGFNNIPDQPWPGPYSYPGSYPDAEHLAALQEKLGIVKPNSAAPALIVNDKEMTLARYPNDKQLTITRVDEPGSYMEPAVPFKISFDDSRVKHWTNAKHAIITGTPEFSWGTLSVTMGEVDVDSLAISSKYPVFHKATVEQRVHIYNLLEEIDITLPEISNEQQLEGVTVVITGSLNHFSSRNELKKLIENAGGNVTGSVTGKTNYLINNDIMSNSSKNKKAKELGVEIISEEDFIDRFNLKKEGDNNAN